MKEGLIPRRYAKALYKYAQEHQCTQQVYTDAQRIEEVFATHPTLSKALGNPAISTTEKEQLLVMASGNEAHQAILRFINLVILNHRESFFRATMLSYQEIYRQENNIARVTIITASAMCDDIMERIKGLLMKQLNKQLEFVYKIDPTLIGGFVLRVDSMQLDASIQNELKKLRVKLLNK
ncbi:MAG: F0F1 ATP synthase subunit delta [Bacteroidaceae bacterium]|jgi:F-type H+-transporting ATPase subunit delta|nr:F0F1 ATP synthase subunit delta [Bacteroidaceae bacterium]MBR5003704.1 F0F1 ATP synthase subunit delta [Bacteroidaceae bacterium]